MPAHLKTVTRRTLLLAVAAIACIALAVPAANAALTVTEEPYLNWNSLSPGNTIQVEAGSWQSSLPDGVDFSYQWQRCNPLGKSCVDMSGFHEDNYELDEADLGHTLRVRVTGQDAESQKTLLTTPSSVVTPASAIIGNGTIGLGIMPTGVLNSDTNSPSASSYAYYYGLRQLSTNYDGIAPGSPQEGWGIADLAGTMHGWSNREGNDTTDVLDPWDGYSDSYYHNVLVRSFTSDEDSATSVVDVVDNARNPAVRMTRSFTPGDQPEVYKISIKLEALQDIGDLNYRQVTDWDAEPTAFNEIVTIMTGDSPLITATSNEGFSSVNPLDGLSWQGDPGNVFEAGPEDLGSAFNFSFGSVSSGEERQFTFYYGIATSNAQALSLLDDIGAEAYSIGRTVEDDGGVVGAPATYFSAFTGIDGDQAPLEAPAGAPETTITSSDVTGSTGIASFESDNALATFECKVGGAPWSVCSSPASFTNLPLGDNWVMVRAVVGGVADPTPAIEVLHRPRPMTLGFKDKPNALTTSDSAYFYAQVMGGYSSGIGWECKLDSGDWYECSPSQSLSDLSLGWHTFSYRVEDGLGATAGPITHKWFIAESFGPQPVTTIGSHSVTGDGVSIEFTSDIAGSTFSCRLDEGSWSECSSPATFSGLAAGAHKFEVFAVADGIPEADAQTLSFEIARSETPAVPDPVAPTTPKMSVSKVKYRAKQLKLKVTCAVASCSVSGWVKVGKKKYKLKTVKVKSGTRTVTLKFDKKLARATKKAKKKKTSWSLTVSGGGKVTKKGKF